MKGKTLGTIALGLVLGLSGCKEKYQAKDTEKERSNNSYRVTEGLDEKIKELKERAEVMCRVARVNYLFKKVTYNLEHYKLGEPLIREYKRLERLSPEHELLNYGQVIERIDGGSIFGFELQRLEEWFERFSPGVTVNVEVYIDALKNTADSLEKPLNG